MDRGYFSPVHIPDKAILFQLWIKVAFIQKVLMHLSFPQTDEPDYFPELEF
jgi:hypothetical protein